MFRSIAATRLTVIDGGERLAHGYTVGAHAQPLHPVRNDDFYYELQGGLIIDI
jgi:hypothetical protein